MSWTSSNEQLPALKLVPSLLFILTACILVVVGLGLSWVVRTQGYRRRQVALETLRAAGMVEDRFKNVPPIHGSLVTARGYIQQDEYRWSDVQASILLLIGNTL